MSRNLLRQSGVKEKLLKELLAYHEETRIKKVKAQEVVLAVIQDPEKTAEALSEVDFDFNEKSTKSVKRTTPFSIRFGENLPLLDSSDKTFSGKILFNN